jgi:hypothetical protein
MVESAATSLASILVLAAGFAFAAYGYHKTYKYMVLKKMANAFEPGDPVLELAAIGKEIPKSAGGTHWVERPEQAIVDSIIAGHDIGHYHLFIGEKGTGKSSMLLEAMRKIDGDGIAMLEAHSDLEIFRIRLGKALDYEFHEDYIGGYFSERGPRDTTALLDIERALNKLEKVALRRRRKVGRPLVLIINQMHLIRDDEDGRDLIELLQQRAEQWAASNLVTMVFNSDDYWVYERLKQLATRMEVLTIVDLPKAQATAALKNYRQRYFNETVSSEILDMVYDRVGGRLNFLNRVAKSKDMLAACDAIKEMEKTWFLNQCWILGEEMDDDVMDQQKWAVSPPPPLLFLPFLPHPTPPTNLSPTGSSGSPRHRPSRQRILHVAHLRPRARARPALLSLTRSATNHDPRRLCAVTGPPQSLQHHQQRTGACQLGAHAPRVQGNCCAAGVPGTPPGDYRPDCGDRKSGPYEGAGCQGSGAWGEV